MIRSADFSRRLGSGDLVSVTMRCHGLRRSVAGARRTVSRFTALTNSGPGSRAGARRIYFLAEEARLSAPYAARPKDDAIRNCTHASGGGANSRKNREQRTTANSARRSPWAWTVGSRCLDGDEECFPSLSFGPQIDPSLEPQRVCPCHVHQTMRVKRAIPKAPRNRLGPAIPRIKVRARTSITRCALERAISGFRLA